MEQLFPPELLKKGRAEKIKYFENCKVAHTKLGESYRSLSEAVEDAKPGVVLTLLGPTGVGKTTILQRLMSESVKGFDPAANPGRMPVVMVEAVKAGGEFRWKDYYIRLLAALYDPIPDRKVDYKNWEVLPTELSEMIRRQSTSEDVYRRALENALKHRRPSAVLIDEAQHIGSVGSGVKTLAQLNIIKSIANMTGIPHVLCGTYELLPFLNLSGQLSRRSGEVHFQRYRLENRLDVEAFQSIVINFQLHLPFPEMPELYSFWEYLYERSLGCIGILHDWLLRATKKALRNNDVTVTEAVLRETSLSLTKCEAILEEISHGEEFFMEAPIKEETLRRKLGLEAPSNYSKPVETKKPAKPARMPGQRNPARDPVGDKAAA